MPAQPAVDQMECVRTGYTQAAMKNEYRMYVSNLVRSAMAPDTMVQAVAANCTDSTSSVEAIRQGQGNAGYVIDCREDACGKIM